MLYTFTSTLLVYIVLPMQFWGPFSERQSNWAERTQPWDAMIFYILLKQWFLKFSKEMQKNVHNKYILINIQKTNIKIF